MTDAPAPPAPPGTPPTAVAPDPDPFGLLDIVDELRDSYLTYAQSVMVSRALPDVRDGLKPSQRRILVAMYEMNLGPTAKTTKCAGIIGDTMKKFHPHGDASIYDTLVRLAQDWVMRARLIHGQGNFGSVAGLPPAAHRYTEARLTTAAAELLADLDHDTVDFIDNYDGSHKEPLVLPGRFPNLLVNGAVGIAVGMATSIPPHNAREVCDALVKMIDDPDVSLLDLLEVMPGPDFPTGGIVMGRAGLIRAYQTGERSRLTLRARADVVDEGKGKSPSILIREVPYQVTRNKLMEDIGELVKAGRIDGITGVRDESSARNGEPVRIVVELKRGADPHLVLNQLYQFSPLQETISLSLLALVDGRPQYLSLKQMMRHFLDHRSQVIRRRTQYLLREARRRGHVLEGQLIAISSIEEVIAICRSSPNRAEAKARLQDMTVAAAVMRRAIGDAAFDALAAELGLADEYRMTEAQAEAVVRLQLGQLAALESDEILREYNKLRDEARGYEELLADDAKVRAVVRADLVRLRDEYGDARRTEITDDGGDLDLEDLIADEPAVVTMTHGGFVKRSKPDAFRVQNRGGKGVSGGLRDDDFVEHFFAASTKAYLLCVTDRGQVYWLKVYRIPEASRTSPGRNIANVLQLKDGEKIASVIPVRSFDGGGHLTMATRNGLVKKTPLADYSRPRAGGIIGIALEDGDALIGVAITRPGDEVVLSTRNGMAIRFSEATVREVGRNSKGVRGINLAGDDRVVGMAVADPDGFLLTVCENGYGKRTPFGANTAAEDDGEAEPAADESGEVAVTDPADPDAAADGPADRSAMRYRRQGRGGKGLKDVRVTDKNGKVIGVAAVRAGGEVMFITHQGMVIRSNIDDIRVVGRNTQGVRVMNLADGDRVVSVAPLARETAPEPAAGDPAVDAAASPGERGA